jgi:hypothetical protein
MQRNRRRQWDRRKLAGCVRADELAFICPNDSPAPLCPLRAESVNTRLNLQSGQESPRERLIGSNESAPGLFTPLLLILRQRFAEHAVEDVIGDWVVLELRAAARERKIL